MKLSNRDIESLEDMRVGMQSLAQGPHGVTTAKTYAESLMRRAMCAFAVGDVEAALWLVNREFAFDLRMFGPKHPFTNSCIACIKALKSHLVATAASAAGSPNVAPIGYHGLTQEAQTDEHARSNFRGFEKRHEGAAPVVDRHSPFSAVCTQI